MPSYRNGKPIAYTDTYFLEKGEYTKSSLKEYFEYISGQTVNFKSDAFNEADKIINEGFKEIGFNSVNKNCDEACNYHCTEAGTKSPDCLTTDQNNRFLCKTISDISKFVNRENADRFLKDFNAMIYSLLDKRDNNQNHDVELEYFTWIDDGKHYVL